MGEPQVGDPGSSCSPSPPGIAGCGALSVGRQQLDGTLIDRRDKFTAIRAVDAPMRGECGGEATF